MKKKQYMVPGIAEYVCHTTRLIMGSSLDPNEDNQQVTPDPEEYNEEFSSRRKGNVWDDEEEEEEEDY